MSALRTDGSLQNSSLFSIENHHFQYKKSFLCTIVPLRSVHLVAGADYSLDQHLKIKGKIVSKWSKPGVNYRGNKGKSNGRAGK